MSKPATRKKPLILVSHDYDPKAWDTLEFDETEFESWLSVTQDLWGLGCYGPGQEDMIRQGANGVAIKKTKVIGAIGSTLGGVGAVAEENDAYIDVIDCDAEMIEHKPQGHRTAVGNKFLKLLTWNPQKPELRADRYHGLIASGALSLTANLSDIAQVITEAVKPGGYLFIDELYATDPSVAALISQGLSRPGQKLHLRPQETVDKTLRSLFLDQRSNVPSAEPLMEAIRTGLTRGQEIAKILRTIPSPFRKQRMTAFANELQRAAVLYQALGRGLITGARSIYRQPGDI